jgi:hypothetical protein
MSDIVTVALIAGSCQVFLGWMQIRAARKLQELKVAADSLHEKVDSVQHTVVRVKEEINGRMDNLLKVTGDSERAKGLLQGRSEERTEESHK